MKLREIINEAEKAGHKRLADRLSKDTGKKIGVFDVSKYLKGMDRKKVMAEIKKNAKKAKDEGAYKYGTIYKIMLQHFA